MYAQRVNSVYTVHTVKFVSQSQQMRAKKKKKKKSRKREAENVDAEPKRPLCVRLRSGSGACFAFFP